MKSPSLWYKKRGSPQETYSKMMRGRSRVRSEDRLVHSLLQTNNSMFSLSVEYRPEKWLILRKHKLHSFFFLIFYRLFPPSPDYRTNTITMPKDSKSWCPPCWSDEQLSPPQLYCSQTCLPSQTESSLPLSNGICHSLLLSDTVSSLHRHQRRKVRPKSDRKKTPQRM